MCILSFSFLTQHALYKLCCQLQISVRTASSSSTLVVADGSATSSNSTTLGGVENEATILATIPKFHPVTAHAIRKSHTIRISPKIAADLTELVTLIASTYRSNNPFHNLQHSCHVTIAMHKLLQLMCTPNFAKKQLDKLFLNSML